MMKVRLLEEECANQGVLAFIPEGYSQEVMFEWGGRVPVTADGNDRSIEHEVTLSDR